MRHTRPYSAVEPTEEGLGGTLAGDERFAIALQGELQLQPGSGPRVLKILDDHPRLARSLALTLGRLYVRHSTLDLDLRSWGQLRRGLLLCASQAFGGAISVERYGAWRLVVEAGGDSPIPVRRNTARMQTNTRPRPLKRPRPHRTPIPEEG